MEKLIKELAELNITIKDIKGLDDLLSDLQDDYIEFEGYGFTTCDELDEMAIEQLLANDSIAYLESWAIHYVTGIPQGIIECLQNNGFHDELENELTLTDRLEIARDIVNHHGADMYINILGSFEYQGNWIAVLEG